MTKITIIQGDITKQHVDAIVNAANSSLLGGGGVDGAIQRAGGPGILAECVEIRDRQGGCLPGEVVITTAGRLKAKKVIHAVGPVWNGGQHNEPALLYNCYIKSLQLAADSNLKTIAFPNISTGVYGYPKPQAMNVAVKAVRDFTEANPTSLTEVIFVCYDEENYVLYTQVLGAAG